LFWFAWLLNYLTVEVPALLGAGGVLPFRRALNQYNDSFHLMSTGRAIFFEMAVSLVNKSLEGDLRWIMLKKVSKNWKKFWRLIGGVRSE
jgi:hypothetical protein